MITKTSCTLKLDRLLQQAKLYIQVPYRCKAQHYFVVGAKLHTAVVLSESETEVGIITRCWGVVFANDTCLVRCTAIHCSYYGESIVLSKLQKELEMSKLQFE